MICRSNFKHGMLKTKEYRAWRGMKSRCYGVKYKAYKNYGGRGIIVCEEWKNDFLTFLKDMGTAPTKKHVMDRIDNNGNYSKDNCRWTTYTVNNRNKRTSVYLEHDGKRMTLAEWSAHTGIHEDTLWRRIMRSKIPLEVALTAPTGSIENYSRKFKKSL